MRNNLPKEYRPYNHLIFCSNNLINVQIPFEIDEHIPLLIGRNRQPQIWLNAPSSQSEIKWIPLIRQNRSLHKAVIVKRLNKEVIIKINNIQIIKVLQLNDDLAKVVQLDLRPIGLNIFGDETRLVVGNNQLVSNTFTDVYIMIKIGQKYTNNK